MNRAENRQGSIKFIGVFLAAFLLGGCLDSDIAELSSLFRVNHIAIDPDPHDPALPPPDGHLDNFTHHGTVYVATDGGGILRSLNGGQTWENVSFGLTDFQVNWIEFDRIDRSEILGQERFIYAGTENSGVFRSTDGGNHWNQMLIGATSISSIVVDPSTCGAASNACPNVYASSLDGGVLMSDDQGLSWSSFFGGDLLQPAEITRLGINNHTAGLPSDLYAGTDTGDVFKVANPTGGPNWVKMTKPGPSEEVYSFSFFGPDQVYVGVSGEKGVRGIYKSITPPPGNVWAEIPVGVFGSDDVRLIFSDPTTSGAGTIFYADAQGISKSTDTGTSWTPIFDDGTNMEPVSLRVFWATVDFHRFDSSEPDPTLRKKAVYFSTFDNFLLKYSDDVTPGVWEWRALDISN